MKTSQRRSNHQFTLLSVLILMATIGICLANWMTYRRIKELDRQLVGLRNIARELVINDAAQYAVVERVQKKYRSCIWDVHLPKNESFSLCLGLDGSGPVTLPLSVDSRVVWKSKKAIAIESGTHKIELWHERNDTAIVAKVFVDDIVVLDVEETHGGVSQWSSQVPTSFPLSTQQTADMPLVLYHEVYSGLKPAIGKAAKLPEAIGVWISKTADVTMEQ